MITELAGVCLTITLYLGAGLYRWSRRDRSLTQDQSPGAHTYRVCHAVCTVLLWPVAVARRVWPV